MAFPALPSYDRAASRGDRRCRRAGLDVVPAGWMKEGRASEVGFAWMGQGHPPMELLVSDSYVYQSRRQRSSQVFEGGRHRVPRHHAQSLLNLGVADSDCRGGWNGRDVAADGAGSQRYPWLGRFKRKSPAPVGGSQRGASRRMVSCSVDRWRTFYRTSTESQLRKHSEKLRKRPPAERVRRGLERSCHRGRKQDPELVSLPR